MDRTKKIEAMQYFEEQFEKRRPVVALLSVMELRNLASYDYSVNRFTFSDEINDSILLQIEGSVCRIFFPTDLEALANADWQGGDIDAKYISFDGRCYVTDNKFTVSYASNDKIDIAVEGVNRIEFATYNVTNDGLILASVLQFRGAKLSDNKTTSPILLKISDTYTASGRTFKPLRETGVHLSSDLEVNSAELRKHIVPELTKEVLARRAELLFGIIGMRPKSEIYNELEAEGVFLRTPGNA